MTNAQKTGTTAFIAVLIMFASNGLSRVLGFAREMLLAALYGTEPEAAAYTYSFLIPEMLNHFLAGSDPKKILYILSILSKNKI